MASASESRRELIARLNREKEQFREEWRRYKGERDTLEKEVEQLQRQLQTTSDGKKRKQLQDDISLTEARKELANSKAEKADALSWQTEYELNKFLGGTYAESEGEIQRYKKYVEEWEDEVRKNKEDVMEIKKKREHYEDLQETSMEGYTCVGRSVLGSVYLPDTIPHTKVDIQSVSDNTVYPKTSANEVLLTPVVSITSQSQMLTMDKPVVIEVMKTVELHAVGDKKIVPMYSNADDSIPPNWEDLHMECEVLDDRFRFKTAHFSYFAVIARFSPPTSSVRVDPETDIVDKLTVPELPGFSVTIPPKSVPSPIEAKATLYYDESDQWKDSANERLASACVRLEPDGQKFSEKVSVSLPIPGYSKIITANPGAKLQLMYSPDGSSNNWEIQEHMEIVEVEGEFVAKFFTDHFSYWRVNWSENVQGVAKAIISIFKRVKSLHGRCQVFMSRERKVEREIKFSIQVSLYPFRDPPHEIPHNYHYILFDSGTLPTVKFTPGKLRLSIKPIEGLFHGIEMNQNHYLSDDSSVLAHFYCTCNLDEESKSRLVEGAVIAHLSVKDSLPERKWNLIKPGPAHQKEEPVVVSPSNGSSLQIVHLQLPSLTATTRLDEKSLNEIIDCLWPARLKWHHIGYALKIDSTTLEVIRRDNCGVDDCFVAVLVKWLKSDEPVPCWKVLAQALSSPPVGVIVTSEEDAYTAQLLEHENNGKGKDSGDLSQAESSDNDVQESSEPEIRGQGKENDDLSQAEGGDNDVEESNEHRIIGDQYRRIPDCEAPVCMCCNKTKFSLFRHRKHHCRHCGYVVCGRCSTNKIVVPKLKSSKRKRVCTTCFESLSTKQEKKQ